MATQLYILLFMIVYLSASVRTEDRQAQVLWKILQLHEQNASLAESYDRMFISQPLPTKRSFPCQVLAPSPSTPTSVHKLRPGDITVVAALGDSLTAGRAVKGGLFGLLIDYRGLAWSIGGDNSYSEVITLPNILRQYNPYLYGFSNGVGSKKARLNVAVTGAKSGEILEQARTLVQRMKADSNVDIAKDWKVITLFVGGNDLCHWCEDQQKYSVASYKSNLQNVLDYLQENVPRAFVNLVEILPAEIVQNLAANRICEVIHKLVCDCAANAKSPEDKAKLIELRKGYQAAARDLAASGRYNVREDFTVVNQPFYRNITLRTKQSGEIDMSYFGSDCFHLSQKGQIAIAEALWNNMVEPVGHKRTSWTPEEVIECPTEDSPYFYTARNSNVTRDV